MNILFLARSLDPGGAERQLAALANGLAGRGHEVHVAVFYAGGTLERDLDGVALHDLRKTGRWDALGFTLRVRALVRRLRPDILHGYLGTPNLLTVLLRPFGPRYRAVWGVRAAFMDLARYGRLEQAHYALERLLSRRADLILLNSLAGRNHAVANGFPQEKMHVVPNGIDTDRFRPLPQFRDRLRSEWGIPRNALLVGLPGRLDPMKDHPVFLNAVAMLQRQKPDACFACIGDGEGRYARSLREMAERLGLGPRLVWTGARRDMPEVYGALDLVCLSSYGEGFPNVLGEAMACGVPCVATDAGDSAEILGELGMIVPPRDPEALAKAMLDMLERAENEGQALRNSLRSRILEKFSLERMVVRTEALLLELLKP
ncbi:glycosyltransferase [Paucidesulfovibrio longus]|uniref:glycosyltransferase n=1 Tax=Paucidesulfovibrio longus TaxID=889 RepID=UPI0003B4A835|nr:glycosyltransferase [Paucidesulfovibrio longus]